MKINILRVIGRQVRGYLPGPPWVPEREPEAAV